MPIVRCTAVINKFSAKPEDAARNVWHFGTVDLAAGKLTEISNGVIAFYTAIASGLAPNVSSGLNAHRLELAEVIEGGPGAGDDQVSKLLATVPFTLPITVSGVALPSQVAAKLTFVGDIEGIPEEQGLIRPASRRRGGIYLGPLRTTVIESNAGTQWEATLTDAFAEQVMDAFDTAHAEWDGASDTNHGVYSRSDGLVYPTFEVRLDESPDIIRRRKIKPRTRFVREISPAVAQTGRTGVEEAIPVP